MRWGFQAWLNSITLDFPLLDPNLNFAWDWILKHQWSWTGTWNWQNLKSIEFNSIFEKNILFKRKSNEEVLFATNLKNIHLFGFFIVIAWQFVSYIWILYHLRNHNDSMFKKNILDKHTLIQRKKTNIVTFYGQLFNFIMEMAFIFGLFIVFNFTIVENSLIPICMLITSSIYSMVEFFTSPEMKRVYWKNIWFRL